jgi:hypothetical protein
VIDENAPHHPAHGTFSKVDLHTGTILWDQEVGTRPSEVLVEGDTACVSVRIDNVIKVFDIGGPEPPAGEGPR